MMNANVLEGLKLIYKGIAEILESASQTENTAETKKPTTEKKSAKTKEVVEETTEDSTEISKETLESMSYNDLKKLAKDFGISAVGNRKELVEKLLSLADSEAEEEPEEKEAPKKSKKSSKKVEEPVEEDEDEEESDESDDEEDDEEDLAKQIEEALEDYSDDELREILEDADIPSKGKRQALITKIVNAVEDGILDLDLEESDEEEDSDDDEVEVEDEEETVEETEDDEEEESKEEDEDITANMTKKRKKAFESMCDETSESFESGDLTREDLIEFINEYNGTNDKMKKVSDVDLLTQYFKIAALFIDDDGAEVEEGAYYINDEPYCCGHPLSYDKKKKQYVCESCGSKYDVED